MGGFSVLHVVGEKPSSLSRVTCSSGRDLKQGLTICKSQGDIHRTQCGKSSRAGIIIQVDARV